MKFRFGNKGRELTMENLRIYDNGGETFDRYTVVLLNEKHGRFYDCIGLSDNCDRPDGFSQYCTCEDGRHLGKKIKFTELPENVQKHNELRLKGN